MQYKFCLTDADARGNGGWLNADNCGQGGRGVKNRQNFADVFYGWPLIRDKNSSYEIFANIRC